MGEVKAGGAFVELSVRDSNFKRRLREDARVLDAFAAKTASIGRKLLTVGGLAAVPLAAAVKVFATFEDKMATVATLLSEQEQKLIPGLSKAVRDMAVIYGQSSLEVAGSLEKLVSAGVSASEAIDTLGVAAKFARAADTDMSTAVKGLTAVLNSFGLSAKESGENIADLFFIINKFGVTRPGLVAENIGNVANIAAGVSGGDPKILNEVAALLAAVTKTGVNTARAVTGLRAVFTAFVKPTDEAKKIAQKYGVELNETTVQTIGLTGAFKKLSKATGGERAQIFPLEALTVASVGMNNLKEVTEVLEAAHKRGGEQAVAFAIKNRTLAAEIGRATSSVQVLAQDIGEALLPVAKELLKDFVKIIQSVRTWVAENPEIIRQFGQFVISVIKLGAAFLSLAGGIKVASLLLSPTGLIAGGAVLVANLGAQFGIFGKAASDSINQTTKGFIDLFNVIETDGIGAADSYRNVLDELGKDFIDLEIGARKAFAVVFREGDKSIKKLEEESKTRKKILDRDIKLRTEAGIERVRGAEDRAKKEREAREKALLDKSAPGVGATGALGGGGGGTGAAQTSFLLSKTGFAQTSVAKQQLSALEQIAKNTDPDAQKKRLIEVRGKQQAAVKRMGEFEQKRRERFAAIDRKRLGLGQPRASKTLSDDDAKKLIEKVSVGSGVKTASAAATASATVTASEAQKLLTSKGPLGDKARKLAEQVATRGRGAKDAFAKKPTPVQPSTSAETVTPTSVAKEVTKLSKRKPAGIGFEGEGFIAEQVREIRELITGKVTRVGRGNQSKSIAKLIGEQTGLTKQIAKKLPDSKESKGSDTFVPIPGTLPFKEPEFKPEPVPEVQVNMDALVPLKEPEVKVSADAIAPGEQRRKRGIFFPGEREDTANPLKTAKGRLAVNIKNAAEVKIEGFTGNLAEKFPSITEGEQDLDFKKQRSFGIKGGSVGESQAEEDARIRAERLSALTGEGLPAELAQTLIDTDNSIANAVIKLVKLNEQFTEDRTDTLLGKDNRIIETIGLLIREIQKDRAATTEYRKAVNHAVIAFETSVTGEF